MFRRQTLSLGRQSLAGSHSLSVSRLPMSTASSQTMENLVKEATRDSEILTRISQETLDLERKAYKARFGYKSSLSAMTRGMWGAFGAVLAVAILDNLWPSIVEPLRGVLTGSKKLRKED